MLRVQIMFFFILMTGKKKEKEREYDKYMLEYSDLEILNLMCYLHLLYS